MWGKGLPLLLLGLYLPGVLANRWDNRPMRRDELSSPAATAFIDSPQTSEGSSRGTAAVSTTTSSHSSATSSASISSADSKSASTTVEVTLSASAATSSAPIFAATSTIYNSTLTPNKLPLQPEITPGFGVAGVILIATGVLYTFVGIRNRWLHIYLSTAYLVCIAIAVLIIYVMNPPVSNAIQGAYVIAAVIPGLLIGGCALIFTDMTEGLGCLLGGFCFSMWLLVLKKGGLVTSTRGKSLLIAVISVAAFSLSFSHYTRSYGLIACISFAGATAVVLGIDCFSRAGLKEFWAYLWNLNDNLFPLGATTYPLTKGIRVEIAAIFIIFLAGVVSQSKLPKLIQDRRAHRLAEKAADRRALDEEELNVGRRVEDQIHMERKVWERAYGGTDGSNTGSSRDSAVCDMESSKKWPVSTVTSIRQSNEDEIEMVEIPLEEEARGPLISETGIRTDTKIPHGLGSTIEPINEEDSITSRQMGQPSDEPRVDSEVTTEQVWVVGTSGEVQLKRRPSQRLSTNNPNPVVTATPDIVAPPFKVSEDTVDEDRFSIAALADEEPLEHNNVLKRVSSGSSELLKRMSRGSLRNSKRYSGKSASTEALVTPHEIEDDRASSLAATMDGFSDDEQSETGSLRSHFVGQDPTSISDAGDDTAEMQPITHSPVRHSGERSRAGSSTSTTRGSGDINGQGETITPKDTDIKSSRRASSVTVATEVTDIPGEDEDSKGLMVPSSPTQSIQSKTKQTIDVAQGSAVMEGRNSTESLRETQSVSAVAHEVPTKITKDLLPPQLSRVVMSYRTNEWAKHLDNADSPDMEELTMGGKNIDESDVEAAAPLDLEALQQTANHSAPPSAPQSSSQPSKHPLHLRSNSNQSNGIPFSIIPEYPMTNDGMPRNYSQRPSQGQPPRRSYRSSSNPTLSYYATDNQANDLSLQPIRPFVQTFTNSVNTLMGKRDTMIRNRSSRYPPQVSQSRSYAPTPALDNFHSTSTSDAGSIRNHTITTIEALPSDADDLPLSHRRTLLHQSALLQPSVHTQPTHFNSHQPRRQSSAPSPMAREQQLASWRATIAQDLQAQSRKEVKDMERKQSILWQERQQEEQRRVLEMRRRNQKERQMDERIRMGGGANGESLVDLHRRVLGRMQEEARGNL
ncbi:hypothetical protein ACMFMF_005479 [Clarireedia jacksonii]